MTAPTAHTPECLFFAGYGQRGPVFVWTCFRPATAGRVVLFPFYIMDETNGSPASKTRRLYVIDFASVAVWATEEERLDHLVYKLLEGDCPEVCETWTLEDIGEDEENQPYEVLNNKDGSSRHV